MKLASPTVMLLLEYFQHVMPLSILRDMGIVYRKRKMRRVELTALGAGTDSCYPV